MAIKEIITVPNPLLKTVSKPVDAIDSKILSILNDMLETMYAAPGIGLAAIQIGIPKRLLVIDIGRDNENRDPHFFINPEILDPAEELSSFEEGCLSVPGVWEEIERPNECNVRFLDINGDEKNIRYSGMMATVIQHEMDHLNGIVFVDYLSRLKKDRAIKKSIKSRTQDPGEE
jgi:peptide deformylase